MPTFGAASPTPNSGDGLTFQGWFDALAGGTRYYGSETFTANKTLYAHWDGWYLDPEGTLTIAGSGPINDYYKDKNGFLGTLPETP